MMIGIVKNIFEIGSGLEYRFDSPKSQSVRVASLVAARRGKVWWPVSPLSRAAI